MEPNTAILSISLVVSEPSLLYRSKPTGTLAISID
jgi:hypothetical protein